MMKRCLAVASIVPIVFLLAVFFIERSFSSLHVAPFYDGCLKVWGHQGHNETREESPLKRFQHAFDYGASGIEFNIAWDPDLESFIVPPKYTYEPEKRRLLTLEEVFGEVGNRGYFWLDMKNLKDLNMKESAAAAKNMSALLDRFDLKNRTIIESKYAAKLAAFGKLGMFTCLWITPGRGDGRVEAWLKMLMYKIKFMMGNFSSFSMNYVNFSPRVQGILHHVPVHLFTINDRSEITDYIAMENVKIILSDRDYFSLGSCDDQKN